MSQREPEMKIQEQEGVQEESDFPFLGGVMAIDLVNTDILLRGKRHDFLVTPEDARAWWRQASLHYPERVSVENEDSEGTMTLWDQSFLEELKRLRTAFRHIFLALVEQHPVVDSDLAILNEVLATGHQGIRRNQAGELVSVYYTTQPQHGAVLLPLALSALWVIDESERSRLHECVNDRCIGLFYDMTRSATRHWCSPECMNRARSLQNYRRAKAKKAEISG